MEEVIKYLEEIKEHQMQTVQLARSTEVYKLANKALKAIDVIHCCKGEAELLKDKEVLNFDDWQKANYYLVTFGLFKSKETGDLDSKKGLLNKYCRYRENL